MKKNLKQDSALAFWDSAFITGALLVTVFLLKHIWPFGSANVTCGDMAQGTLPVFYHVYDWLHGEKSLLFDWYSGLGVSMAASYCVTPFDLVLYLFKRDHLIYALGVVVWLKSVTAAFTARLSFERMFPNAPSLWKILFSVSYALSGYAMNYYTNLSWLDFVILFPLLLWGVKRLLDENKPLLYTLSYAAGLYLSFYQGYMITLAVFFLGGLYLLVAVSKEDKPQRSVLFGVSTLIGSLLSCIHSVPFALLSLTSQRFGKNVTDAGNKGVFLYTLRRVALYAIGDKLALVVGLEFAAAFALLFLLRSLRAKKFRRVIFIVVGIIFMFSQILFENVNLFWHGGDYMLFPMRFFYTSVLFLFCLALAYLDQYGENLRPLTEKRPIMINRGATLLLSAIFLALLFLVSFSALSSAAVFPAKVMLFTFGLVITVLSVRQNRQFARLVCAVLVLAECTGIAYNGIANREQRAIGEMLYQSESYVDYCREAVTLDLSTSVLGRIKNPDTSLNTNYPFLTKTQALSNWTHFIPSYLQRTASALGYSNQYTRLLDSGGTVFSDSLLGMEKAIARNAFQMAAGYSLIQKSESFSLYRNEYALPPGLTADEALLTDLTAGKDSAGIINARFDTQNALYRMFSKTDEDLITYADSNGKTAPRIDLNDASAERIIFTYSAEENEVLYLNVCGFTQDDRVFVIANNRYIGTPYYKHVNYVFYPTDAVNGLLEIGSFSQGETVVVQIVRPLTCSFDMQKRNFQLGYLSLDKMAVLKNDLLSLSNLTQSKTGLSFDYSNEKGKRYLFLPISYDSGWKATVNGQKCEVKQALGAYLAVELPDGNGHVALRHTTPFRSLGMVLSLVGAIGLALMLLWRKRYYRINKTVAKIVFILFIVVFSAAVLVIYVASFAQFALVMLPILFERLHK